jgi:hypothetical protein
MMFLSAAPVAKLHCRTVKSAAMVAALSPSSSRALEGVPL